MSKKGLKLDYEAADRITILNLKKSRKFIKKEIAKKDSLDKMPDYLLADYGYDQRLILAMTTVLNYYGED